MLIRLSAQLRLANALKNVTGATEAQISAVEEQILKTSLATGVGVGVGVGVGGSHTVRQVPATFT